MLKKIIFVVLFLAIVGGAGWYYYNTYFYPKTQRVQDENVPKKLINADEKIIQLSSPQDIKNVATSADTSANSFEVIFISNEKNGARHFLTPLEFFEASGLHAPQKLFSEIKSYNYGIANIEGKNYPFLILSTSGSNASRNGIADWEKTLPKDMKILFPELQNLSGKDDINFQDKITQNQNIRFFLGSAVEVAYSFYNQDLLIITSSRQALDKIIYRYSIFPPN